MNNKNMNKRGISTIIATLLIVVITLVAMGILYTVVTDIVYKNTQKSDKCGADIIGKITINGAYTCEATDNNPYPLPVNIREALLSVSVKDVTIDKLLVIEEYKGQSKTMELTEGKGVAYYYVVMADALRNKIIDLPAKNEGKTYIVKTGAIFLNLASDTDIPDSISIIPVIGGQQCDVVDKIVEIPTCAALFAP